MVGLAATTVHAAGPPRARGIDLAPMAQLHRHDGGRLDAAELRKRPFVVVFGFTACPDVCPTALLELSNLIKDLGSGGEQIGAYFVSVDHERDTASQLQTYLTAFHPRIVGLTGEPLDILAAATAFDASYQRVSRQDGEYAFDHSTHMYVVDSYGLLAAVMPAGMDGKRKRDVLLRVLAQRQPR